MNHSDYESTCSRSSRCSVIEDETLKRAIGIVDVELDEIETFLGNLQVPEFNLGREIIGNLRASPGKRLRPLMMLLVARLGGRADRDSLAVSGAMLEILHTASLVHDDCIDEAKFRRGVPTVQSALGVPTAIITGDYLITQCFHELSSRGLFESVSALSQGAHEMTIGMLRELSHRNDCSYSVDSYLEVADGKTASLFAAACKIGAQLGGLTRPEQQQIEEFSRNAGIAFQIIDDVLDYTGTPEMMGKNPGTDFQLGFAGLPLLLAMERDSGGKSREVADSFEKGNPGEREFEMACSLVQETGADRAACTIAERFYNDSLVALHPLENSERESTLSALRSLVGFVVNRTQ